MQNEVTNAPAYGFGPLVPECKRRGIAKTKAFELASRGLLDTFMIGRKRFVRIASLESLPDRLRGDPALTPSPRE